MHVLLCFCIDAKQMLRYQNNNSLDNIEVTETKPGMSEDNNLEHRSDQSTTEWLSENCIYLNSKSSLEICRKHKITEAYIP